MTSAYFSAIRSQHSRNLQQADLTCQTGLNMGGKTRNIAFQSRFAAMLQNKLLVVVALFTELKMELTFA